MKTFNEHTSRKNAHANENTAKSETIGLISFSVERKEMPTSFEEGPGCSGDFPVPGNEQRPNLEEAATSFADNIHHAELQN